MKKIKINFNMTQARSMQIKIMDTIKILCIYLSFLRF